jgi:hypothetical protein
MFVLLIPVNVGEVNWRVKRLSNRLCKRLQPPPLAAAVMICQPLSETYAKVS